MIEYFYSVKFINIFRFTNPTPELPMPTKVQWKYFNSNYPLISYIWSVTKQPPLSHPSLKLGNFLGWLTSTDGSASHKEEIKTLAHWGPVVLNMASMNSVAMGLLPDTQNCRLRMRRECRERFQRKPLVSDPGMHHGTCLTHVPWCMSGSLTCGDGGNVPGIPGACAPAILRIWQEAHSFRQWLITCPCRVITYTIADFLPDRWCCRWRFKMKMKCQANFLVLNT